jgi:hypothetical protein
VILLSAYVKHTRDLRSYCPIHHITGESNARALGYSITGSPGTKPQISSVARARLVRKTPHCKAGQRASAIAQDWHPDPRGSVLAYIHRKSASVRSDACVEDEVRRTHCNGVAKNDTCARPVANIPKLTAVGLTDCHLSQ